MLSLRNARRALEFEHHLGRALARSGVYALSEKQWSSATAAALDRLTPAAADAPAWPRGAYDDIMSFVDVAVQHALAIANGATCVAYHLCHLPIPSAEELAKEAIYAKMSATEFEALNLPREKLAVATEFEFRCVRVADFDGAAAIAAAAAADAAPRDAQRAAPRDTWSLPPAFGAQ